MSTATCPQLRPHGQRHPIFAERLAERIKASGLRKSALARRLGFDQGMVNYWLGGGEPRLATLVQLARILKTTPHYLLGWSEREAS